MLVDGSGNICGIEDGSYWEELGLGAGFDAGFLAGLEMPKLMRKKRKPLRRESSRLMKDLSWKTTFIYFALFKWLDADGIRLSGSKAKIDSTWGDVNTGLGR